MQWTPGGNSSDIEDRRSEGGGGGFNFGGGGFGGMHLGLGGIIILLILSAVFRVNLLSLFSGGVPNSQEASRPLTEADRAAGANSDRQVQFVSFVLDDVQNTWDRLLPEQVGVPYRHAKLVLFRDYTDTGCGTAQSATGPFYCPVDEKVYIDLSFFDELRSRFGAPGEFAQAYVIAHEIGHHVQKILGIEQQVSSLRRRDPSLANPLSVKLELQADCLSGVWGHSTEQRKIVDSSDVAAGIQAAASVGDDRLQRMASGHVSPETFTHGSSAQRTAAFQGGMEAGQIGACGISSR
jgi:predicted metalloprotease